MTGVNCLIGGYIVKECSGAVELSYDWVNCLIGGYIVKECSRAVELSYDWGELFDWWIVKECSEL